MACFILSKIERCLTSRQNKLFDIGSADWPIPDPGSAGVIPPSRTGIVNIVTAAAETRTLAIPTKDGLLLVLNFVTDGGDCVITVASAIDDAGTTTITLNEAGDFVFLISRKYGSTYRWRNVTPPDFGTTQLLNTADSTVGEATLTAAAIVGGLITRTGSTAAYTDTTATAALIYTALGSSAIAGQSWMLSIKNTVGFNQTIAAGSGVTLTGQTIIPPFSVGNFLVTLTSPTAVSIRGVGMSLMTTPPLETNTAITTVGAGTLTAAGIVGRLVTRSGSTAAYIDTIDTAVNILAAMPNVNVGDAFEFQIRNTVAFPETVATATGVTLAGNVIVPPLSVGRFLVVVTASTTVTVTGMGSMPISNLLDAKFVTAAAGTSTFAAGDLTGARFVVYRNTGNGAISLTTRTAAEMFGDIPNAQIGQTYMLMVSSQGDNTVTILAGSNLTLTGTMTMATKTTRIFVVTLVSASAVTIQSVSVGSIE